MIRLDIYPPKTAVTNDVFPHLQAHTGNASVIDTQRHAFVKKYGIMSSKYQYSELRYLFNISFIYCMLCAKMGLLLNRDFPILYVSSFSPE